MSGTLFSDPINNATEQQKYYLNTTRLLSLESKMRQGNVNQMQDISGGI